MPSDENPGASPVDQDVTATRDAYAAGRDIHQHYYGPEIASHASSHSQPRADDDPWTALARDDVTWQKSKSGLGRDELKVATLTIVTRLHHKYSAALAACSDDPWLDVELPFRTSEQVGTLLQGLPKESLSPAEAALFTIAPFLRATQRMVNASEHRPSAAASAWLSEPVSQETEPLARFARAYPRLSRTFATSPPDTAAAIAWWIFHRWLDYEHARMPNRKEAIGRLVGFLPTESPWPVASLLQDVLSGQRLADALRDMDGDLALLTDPDRKGHLALNHTTPVGRGVTQQLIRDRLVGYSLMLASAMALDPSTLGSLVVEHVGAPDEVSLADLLATIRGARWTPHKETRLVLHAYCRHEAVEIALRERVPQVGAILDALHKQVISGASDLSELGVLPNRAVDEEVTAATDERDRPVYLSPGMRFRLADDQIRELLMGENLYSDKALAIRELYQNALDACRYRRARAQWLEHTRGSPDPLEPSWEGAIRFSQGVDEDGRAYLDCSDNGIGMGEHELRQVFSQAGARFVDLPEFLEEQANWTAADIKFAANSRFGIGVLSYFMLADTIEVTTCRLDREGAPGEKLRVMIPGPGSLFRLHRIGKGKTSGTSVRLYLNTSQKIASCVDTLRRLLFVSEFQVEARDQTKLQTWKPNELSAFATAAASREFEQKYQRSHSRLPLIFREPLAGEDSPLSIGTREIIPARDAPVWWCSGMGGILADGLWAGETLYGAFVNLTGTEAPELTVDRRSIRKYNKIDVQRHLRQAAPAVCAVPSAHEEGLIGSYQWLCTVASDDPLTASAILSGLTTQKQQTWRIMGIRLKVDEFGCLASDLFDDTFSLGKVYYPTGLSGRPLARASAAEAWRRAALLAGTRGRHSEGAAGAITIASPVDDIILERATRSKIAAAEMIWAALQLDLSLPEISSRISDLGFDIPNYCQPSSSITPDVGRLVELMPSTEAWNDSPWQRGSLIAGAAATALTIQEVVSQLAKLGYNYLKPTVEFDGPVTDQHVQLVSLNLNGRSAWLEDDQRVPLAHLIRAAHALGRELGTIALTLRELGYPVAPVRNPLVRVTDTDLHLVNTEPLIGNSRSLVDEEAITAHAIYVAKEQGFSILMVISRLRELGYKITANPINEPTKECIRLTSINIDGSRPRLPDAEVIPKAFISMASARLELPTSEVVTRLTGFGYRVVDTHDLPDELEEHDKELLNKASDEDRTWLTDSPDGNLRLSDISTVSRAHLMALAATFRRQVADVANRLSRLGFTVPDIQILPKTARRSDIILVSESHDGSFPLLPDSAIFSLPELICAAEGANLSIQEAISRLHELGYTVHVQSAQIPEEITRTDLRLISPALEWDGDWLSPDHEIDPSHLLAAAITLDMTIDDAARRLEQLGYQVCPVREFSSPGAYLRAMEEHQARTRAAEASS